VVLNVCEVTKFCFFFLDIDTRLFLARQPPIGPGPPHLRGL